MENLQISPQDAAIELLKRRAARKALQKFTEYTTPRWSAGKIHRIICEQLDRVMRREVDRLMLLCPPQHGKQLAHDTPILTPDGWVRHGDLFPGSFVYGSDGNPTEVIAVSSETDATLRLVFADGETIDCHERHEWVVYDRKNARKCPKIVEARELFLSTLWEGARGRRGNRARFSVDSIAICGAEREVPVEPYALGAWLGDGTSTGASIVYAPDDVATIDEVSRAYQTSTFSIHKLSGVRKAEFGRSGLRIALKAAGVLGDKHIPGIYLSASISQRQRLLAGLIDTDGYVHHKTRRACFSSCSRRLADDVAVLVRTLGMRATIAEFAPILSSSGIQGRKPVFQVTFSPTISIPCALERKRTNGFAIKYRRRAIVSVERIEPKPGRCIQVSNSDGIYLAGRGLVPTHNSTCASLRLPAYALGIQPHIEVISASATASLAEEFGREVRNCVSSQEYKFLFPETTLAEDSQAKGRWNTSQGGGYYAVGIGGALMGRGGELGIIDDPFSTWDDAQSEVTRNRVWEWYNGTFYNRMRPGSAIIVIQHRMHEDDLVGRLLKAQESGGDRWEVVELPALLDDPPWPERYNREALERIKANTPPRKWSALYLQKPTPDEGTYFKREWFNFYKESPQHCNKYLSSDFGVSEDGDATEIGIHGIAPSGDLYLCIDGWGGQKNADVWIDEYLTLVARHKTLCEFNEAGVIRRAIEPFLLKRRRERQIYGRAEWLPPISDKPARARSLQGMASMGRVWLPDNEYGHRVLTDLLKFPASADDHTVDMCALIALALDQAHSGITPQKEVPKKRERWRFDDDEEEANWKTA